MMTSIVTPPPSSPRLRFCESNLDVRRLKLTGVGLLRQQEASLSYITNLVDPFERLGVRVDILFTFPSCPHAPQLLKTMLRWFAPRVVAHRVVDGENDGHSERLGWDMLWDRIGQHAPYDYVLRGRHDVVLTPDFSTWPVSDWDDAGQKVYPSLAARLTHFYSQSCNQFDLHARPLHAHARSCSGQHNLTERVLFLQQGLDWGPEQECGFSCYQHQGGLTKFEAQLRLRPIPKHCGQAPTASVCTSRQLLWVPRRFIGPVVHQRSSGHALIIGVEREIGRENIGFLLPASCDTGESIPGFRQHPMLCGPVHLLYRPLNLSRESADRRRD